MAMMGNNIGCSDVKLYNQSLIKNLSLLSFVLKSHLNTPAALNIPGSDASGKMW